MSFKERRRKTRFLNVCKKNVATIYKGKHHKIISEKFNKIASGEKTRLIINMCQDI